MKAPTLRVVGAETPVQRAAAAQREAREQANAAFDDAVSLLSEGAIRAAEVLQVCDPSTVGVGRHARLARLTRELATELAQIGALPR